MIPVINNRNERWSVGQINLKVHKRENFFGSEFEFFTILQLIKLKY